MYKIIVSEKAFVDIETAIDYISNNLKNSQAADNLIDEIEKTLKLLKINPLICPILNDIYLSAFEIRAAIIKNYMAFYIVNKKGKKIYIVRFLYAKRNWQQILSN